MNIHKLILNNFKSVSRLDIDLTENGSNVICFVGENGSAKTSILNLIAEALVSNSQLKFPDSPEERKRYRLISPNEIKTGEQFYSMEIEYKGTDNKTNYFKKLVGSKGLSREVYSDAIKGVDLSSHYYDERSSEDSINPNLSYLFKNVFLIRPSQRYEFDGMDPLAVNHKSEITSREGLANEMPYPFSVSHSGKQIQDLILELYFDAFVGYQAAGGGIQKITELLEKVTGKIFGRMQITQSPYRQVLFSKVGKIKNLSQGELDLLVTVVSIITQQLHLFRQYSVQVEHDVKIDQFFNVPGIVIIDEVDLHLHPRAQERYLKTLTEIFPNIQFVISTHSPFVIRGLPSGSVVVNLPSGNIFDDNFATMDIDSITNIIFKYEGGFSSEFLGKLKKFKRMLVSEEKDTPKLKEMYIELSSSSSGRDELDLYLASYASEELSNTIKGA
ncbi:AAA family ATPase [Shewanella sp. 10N.286.45.A1]|uniref:AAA family ATPase n=1 Tax=Shewanella sp. 10N.286.45.A1 TaxID=3229694 RepID=UPI0035544E51